MMALLWNKMLLVEFSIKMTQTRYLGSTVIYYELKPTKIFCLFVAAANISQTIYGEVCIACDEIYAFVNEKSLLHIYRLSWLDSSIIVQFGPQTVIYMFGYQKFNKS